MKYVKKSFYAFKKHNDHGHRHIHGLVHVLSSVHGHVFCHVHV